MTGHTYQYQLGDSDSIEALLTALSSQFHLGTEPKKSVRHLLFDSFDWRLFQAGMQLDEVQDKDGHHLVLRSLADDSPYETIRLEGEVPRFTWNYSAGLMRERIAGPLQMRALLPVVEIRSQVIGLNLLDREEKTVVRLQLEENRARPAGRADYQPMTHLIRLLPVRGYDKYLKQVSRFLSDKVGLLNQSQPLISLALEAIGRKPMDYSSKLDFDLQPDTPAGEVARQIHTTLLDTLEQNLPGTRADLDSEFLHDLRVAIRRTRSALTQIKGVFPDAIVEEFKERFSWIGSITGPTRDLDVYLLGFEGYRDTLPEQFQSDLDPLHAFLVSHQKIEQQAMVRKLKSPHFHKLLKDWRAFLSTQADPGSAGDHSQKPIKKVARKRIYKTFKLVLEEGLAIHPHSQPDELHELRKSCKKLRYLLEFFQSLYPKEEIKPLIKTLKSLLDNLGDYQDLEVQAYKLREFAHQMVQEGAVPADTLLAMGMLVDGLLKRQQEARLVFAERFAQFADEQHVERYNRLFATKQDAKLNGAPS
ncbi:CHAD domain-containing protein [Sedimenticola selenatireducens]|uniref:CHAD domain-containing protein n=1 Tax=Sedimenticola selenatireducens TaxID=191960 RepID=A0A557SDJ1_9GAMM|nr:CHAD domain-containing protein [Sedimenticola selenatireducens]TVO75485.1 CHAD domain-containing protein [Sedimenticola selenatireducens]TVT65391.1 MAG: CHAD domain-containing protein [Sedimenticola selenatireducens]